MHIRGKQISKCLEEELQIPIPGTTTSKNILLARILVNIAFDEKQPAKIRLEALKLIMDRTEGTPVNINLNADITANPFEGIDTDKIETLKKKLEEITELKT